MVITLSSMDKARPAAGRVTIHEVAARAQVSIKTVSRVLRREARVSPATRAAVERAVQEVGYLPDLSARSLKSSVPNTLGLVRAVDSEPSAYMRSGHEYVMCLQVGAMRATRELDFGLLLVPVLRQAADALREVRERFRRREVAGFLLPAPACDLPGLLDALTAEGIPHVAISPNRLEAAAQWVAADERAGAEAVVTHLVANGHRHIAYISGEPNSRASAQREAGWRDALRAAGIKPKADWIVEAGEFGFDAGRRAGHQLLARAQRPSAVFAASDNIAAGVVNAAYERGLRLPQDLSIAGYDDLDLARKVWPNLTTVRHPIERLGEAAARLLVARVQPLRQVGQAPAPQALLPCDLVTRGSVAPPAH